MTVTIQDNGMKRLLDNLRKSADTVSQAGVFADGKGGDIHPDSNITTVELAAIHKHGAPTAGIPKRDFVTLALNNVDKTISRLLKNAIRDIDNESVSRRLGLAALTAAKSMQRVIMNPTQPRPKLKRATVESKARKGAPLPTTPLYEFGTLHDSIESRVDE